MAAVQRHAGLKYLLGCSRLHVEPSLWTAYALAVKLDGHCSLACEKQPGTVGI